MNRETSFEFEYLGPHGADVFTVHITFKPATPSTGPSPEDYGDPAELVEIESVYGGEDGDTEIEMHGTFVPVIRSDLRWYKERGLQEVRTGAAYWPASGEHLVRDTEVLTHLCTGIGVYQIVPLKTAITDAAERHLEGMMARGEAYAGE